MEKVNNFYNSKEEEISHTLTMLEDHVRSSLYLNTSLIKVPGRNRLDKTRTKKSQLDPEINRGEHEKHEHEAFTHNTRISPHDSSREVESVKRAIIDLHRRSKLLENFAIMNTTAFVHIVKKFDSILIEHRGRFSLLGNDDNICGGGIQASSLCEKMVCFYPTSFQVILILSTNRIAIFT